MHWTRESYIRGFTLYRYSCRGRRCRSVGDCRAFFRAGLGWIFAVPRAYKTLMLLVGWWLGFAANIRAGLVISPQTLTILSDPPSRTPKTNCDTAHLVPGQALTRLGASA